MRWKTTAEVVVAPLTMLHVSDENQTIALSSRHPLARSRVHVLHPVKEPSALAISRCRDSSRSAETEDLQSFPIPKPLSPFKPRPALDRNSPFHLASRNMMCETIFQNMIIGYAARCSDTASRSWVTNVWSSDARMSAELGTSVSRELEGEQRAHSVMRKTE